MKYHLLEGGEWVKLEVRRGNKIKCCDCGLIHFMDLKVRRGKVFRRFTRDDRATGQARRWMKRLKRGVWS